MEKEEVPQVKEQHGQEMSVQYKQGRSMQSGPWARLVPTASPVHHGSHSQVPRLGEGIAIQNQLPTPLCPLTWPDRTTGSDLLGGQLYCN